MANHLCDETHMRFPHVHVYMQIYIYTIHGPSQRDWVGNALLRSIHHPFPTVK